MSTKPLAKQVVHGANGAESVSAQDGAIRPRDSLFHWCGTADSIRHTEKRLEKRALLEAYFDAVAEHTIGPAARFFAGSVLPRDSGRTVRVDQSLIVDAIRDLTRVSAGDLHARQVKYGELGDAAADIFAGRLPSGLSVTDAARWAEQLAGASETDARRALVRDMLARLSGLEVQYVVKLIGGDLRIGVREALILDALANAFSQPLEAVRHANVLRGDIGEVARLARRRELDDAPLASLPRR